MEPIHFFLSLLSSSPLPDTGLAHPPSPFSPSPIQIGAANSALQLPEARSRVAETWGVNGDGGVSLLGSLRTNYRV